MRRGSYHPGVGQGVIIGRRGRRRGRKKKPNERERNEETIYSHPEKKNSSLLKANRQKGGLKNARVRNVCEPAEGQKRKLAAVMILPVVGRLRGD